jgi:hypothetical protein
VEIGSPTNWGATQILIQWVVDFKKILQKSDLNDIFWTFCNITLARAICGDVSGRIGEWVFAFFDLP